MIQGALEGHTLPKYASKYTWKPPPDIYFFNKEQRGEGAHNIKELPNKDHQLPGSLLVTKSRGTEQRQ